KHGTKKQRRLFPDRLLFYQSVLMSRKMDVNTAVVLALVLGTAIAQSPIPLTLLTDPTARCMDGTLSGYYLEKASAPQNATKYVIFLEGGGECTTQQVSCKSCSPPGWVMDMPSSRCIQACYAQLNTSLGSSKYFAPSIYMQYFLTDDQA